MEKNNKKLNAFTLTEALVVLIILGIIAAITIPAILKHNPTEQGWDTMAEKTAGILVQTNNYIFLYDTKLDDFSILKHGDSEFSITSTDATQKYSDLHKKYIAHVVGKINLSDKYFTSPLIDYNKTSTGNSLKDTYSNFFYTNDGVVMGFRTYGNCTTTETNANPPTHRKKYAVPNSCGSIFYDINGFKGPNKLGSDQYIIPVGIRGIKYEDN